jgi:hypothetical protein
LVEALDAGGLKPNAGALVPEADAPGAANGLDVAPNEKPTLGELAAKPPPEKALPAGAASFEAAAPKAGAAVEAPLPKVKVGGVGASFRGEALIPKEKPTDEGEVLVVAAVPKPAKAGADVAGAVLAASVEAGFKLKSEPVPNEAAGVDVTGLGAAGAEEPKEKAGCAVEPAEPKLNDENGFAFGLSSLAAGAGEGDSGAAAAASFDVGGEAVGELSRFEVILRGDGLAGCAVWNLRREGFDGAAFLSSLSGSSGASFASLG